jgi:hypothetical protein
MISYSQAGQDIFVLNILKSPGKFLDLGCYLPDKINNTYLLEKNGWDGVSVDITDYSNEWELRNSKFIQMDCLSADYKIFLDLHYSDSNNVIDYLSIDMELLGDRYSLLNKVMLSGYEFKIITIEHDSHLGNDYIDGEKNKQMKLLSDFGYYLLCNDVSNYKNPDMFYEDWYINPKYIDPNEFEILKSSRISCDQIFLKAGIEYKISDISKNWDDYKI